MRSYRPLVLLTVFTVLTAIVSMGVGHYPVSPLAVIDVLWSAVTGRPTSQPSVVANVVLVVRLPRVLAAILVGAMQHRAKHARVCGMKPVHRFTYGGALERKGNGRSHGDLLTGR